MIDLKALSDFLGKPVRWMSKAEQDSFTLSCGCDDEENPPVHNEANEIYVPE